MYLHSHLDFQNKWICLHQTLIGELALILSAMCFWLSRVIWIRFLLVLSQSTREVYAMSHCPQAAVRWLAMYTGTSCKASHCNLLSSKHQTKSWPEVGAMSLSHTCTTMRLLRLAWVRQTAGTYCQRASDIQQMVNNEFIIHSLSLPHFTSPEVLWFFTGTDTNFWIMKSVMKYSGKHLLRSLSLLSA